MMCFPSLVKFEGISVLVLMKCLSSSSLMSIGAIITVSSTYSILPNRVVRHQVNDAILLSFTDPVGAIKNLMIGQMG